MRTKLNRLFVSVLTCDFSLPAMLQLYNTVVVTGTIPYIMCVHSYISHYLIFYMNKLARKQVDHMGWSATLINRNLLSSSYNIALIDANSMFYKGKLGKS
jgi:hypothetical protein